MSQAVKKVPQLEELHLSDTCIEAQDLEVIGRNCPQLKSFKMITVVSETFKCNEYAFAIANSMPKLTHLELIYSHITNDELETILNGCPHLQSLDLRKCHNLDLDGNLGKLCMERIKDFKHESTGNCEFEFPSHLISVVWRTIMTVKEGIELIRLKR